MHWSEFHYAWKYVNADNEVISHRSEILHQSEISNRLEFTLTKVKFDRSGICTEVKSQTGLSSLRLSHVNMLLKAIICTFPQWNCHVNGTTFQSGLRFQHGLSSLRVLCKRALYESAVILPILKLHMCSFK